ncbi:hypothetical protein [Olivibacter jilunii]|uniref:hypothetical protein n=1 Tax=Olivibacter jilunii TaxID=985016 RepID=UPI003F17864C
MMFLSSNALRLLRLLRRWSVGSIGKFAEEMQLDPESVLKAAYILEQNGYILTVDIADDCPYPNKMLEINALGLSFLEGLDGRVDNTQDKT